MFPAVGQARVAARRTQSRNNLKQIGLAMHNFHDVNLAFPASYSVDKNDKPLLSWRVYVLPYIDQAALYNQFHLDEPWDSDHNKKLIARMPRVYRSPKSKADPGKTVYLGNAAEKGVFGPPKDVGPNKQKCLGARIRDITDGTSNTMMVVEASDDQAVIWTKPDDFEPDKKNPMKGLVGLYDGGFNAALCDGSVRFISERVKPTLLRALFTMNGEEVLSP